MAELFPRVSKLDSVYGRVSMRKLFGALSDADVAALVARVITWAKRGPAPDAVCVSVETPKPPPNSGAYLALIDGKWVECESMVYADVAPLLSDDEWRAKLSASRERALAAAALARAAFASPTVVGEQTE